VQLCWRFARIVATLNSVRRSRLARALTASEMARQCGVSRQALSAIETNLYQPNVIVALRIAQVLGVGVESLFGQGDDDFRSVEARWTGDTTAKFVHPRKRVDLGRVGGKVVAVWQPSARLTLSPSCGLLEGAKRGKASVSTMLSGNDVNATLLIAGCDPAVSILTAWMARHRSPIQAVGIPCSSKKALAALASGSVHAAGMHLRDPHSGEYNLAAVGRSAGGGAPMVLVNFAQWEIGIATAPGNPLGIRGFEDFARKEVGIVNREQGSGARHALDEALEDMKPRSEKIRGYHDEVGGHLEVAAAIATNRADAGVTIRVAADVYGLGFIATREERYDLVIAESEMESLPVTAMLDALHSTLFLREVSQFCQYDTRRMGQIVGRINQ
jgi:putative molybdopterin biosynthesis protein